MSRKQKLIEHFLVASILVSVCALVVSAAIVILAALDLTNIISIFDDSARYIGDLAAGTTIMSTLVFVVSVSLLKLIIDKRQSTEEQFKQKYVSMFTDDTKARRELADLYRKKESV